MTGKNLMKTIKNTSIGYLLALLLLLAACSTTDTQTASVATDNASQTQVENATTVEESVSPTAIADTTEETAVAGDARPEGWSEETHSNDVDPNYAVVFPQDQVNTMTITIVPEDWQAMLDNMTELYGEPSGNAEGGGFGAGAPGAGRPAGGGGQPAGFDFTELLPEGCELPEGFVPGPDAEWPAGCEPELAAGGPAGGGRPQGGGERGGGVGGGAGGLNIGGSENPDYVAATIEFAGDVWTNVGVRFKGNSTLTRGWNSGSVELPFKLDFDEFEDDYPEIDNQRFYGFKQLSLSSPSTDDSYVRAALAYDVMQDAGLIAPETAWYELFVDYGEGPVSFGLYTVIEVVDDSVIKTALGDDDGNIYEGDGNASSLALGTLDQLAGSFEKENNDEADYSDLEALYNALHAETRLTDSDQWRSDLEAVFDVDTFLKWLAVNSVIVNWDTYGEMAHNYYLYHDPETDLLTWIGWDYNESLESGGRGGNTSLSQQEETDAWPLIRYLLDQPTYYDQYVAFIAEIDADAFDAETVATKLQAWETLLAPYVANSAQFTAQIDTITNFVAERHNVVELFLSETNN